MYANIAAIFCFIIVEDDSVDDDADVNAVDVATEDGMWEREFKVSEYLFCIIVSPKLLIPKLT